MGDDFRGGYIGVRYLFGLGHGKILVITGLDALSSTRNRLGGFLRFLQDAGKSLNVPDSDESIRTMASSYEQVMGKKPNVLPSPFVGDVNYMFEKGIKGVNWGPGDLSMGIHGANEYVPVDQVLNAAKVYAAAAVNWCGVAG